jgi:hypothetical protein
MLALSFVTIIVWNTHFSWWAMIIGIIIPCVWVVPIRIIFATTNVQIGFILSLFGVWDRCRVD